MIKRMFDYLPLKWKLFFIERKGIFNLRIYKNNANKIHKSVNMYKKNSNSIKINDSITEWEKYFRKFILAQPEEVAVATNFFTSDIQLIKEYKNRDIEKTILVTVIKDDLYRAQKFYEHYSRLGVENFAIIDNNSTDGTFEYFLDKDVELFQIKDKYTTQRREAWINRVIAYYGFDKWYIVVDSDELLIFNDCESKNIDDIISFYESIDVYRGKALMIDMYSKNGLFSSNSSDPYQELVYFDIEGYYRKQTDIFDSIYGGVRARLFDTPALLTKYPIFKFKRGFIHGKSHFQYPYVYNNKTDFNLGILHYKFLNEDLEKYYQIAKDGNYYDGSSQYKQYLNFFSNNTSNNTHYKGSKRLIDSHSIYDISYLKKVEWSKIDYDFKSECK